MSRPAQPAWVVCILSTLLALPAIAAEASGKMSIVGGANDVVHVQVKDEKADEYFRTAPGGEHILVVADGPATLSIRFRAAATGRSSGTLRILRDDGPFSDNTYDLARDMNAKVELTAVAEGNAASAERVLHVRVEAGEHRYEIAAAKGPPLLVRVFKTSKYDPALAPAPEKNTSAAVVREPTPAATPEEKTPKSDESVATVAELDAGPRPSTAPTAIERAPASLNEPTEPVATPSGLMELPTSLERLPEKAAPKINPNFHKGFSINLNTGRYGFLGFSREAGAGNGAIKLSNRIWGWIPVALELSYNINGKFGLFLEGGYYRGVRPHIVTAKTDAVPVESEYRVIPALAGASYFVPFGMSRFGLRFKAGVGVAYLESRTQPQVAGNQLPARIFQSGWGLTATGGMALEMRLGPGRLALEGRYLMLRTNAGIDDPMPKQNVNAIPHDLGGIQCTVGYRLQL